MRSIRVVINGVPLILCYLGYSSLLPLYTAPAPKGLDDHVDSYYVVQSSIVKISFGLFSQFSRHKALGISQCNNEKTLGRHRSAGPDYFRKQPSLPTPEVGGSHLNFYS